MDFRRTEARGSQRRQAAARAHIQKRFSIQIFHLQYRGQRRLRIVDALLVEQAQEACPVPAELKPLGVPDFPGVRRHLLFPEFFSRSIIALLLRACGQ